MKTILKNMLTEHDNTTFCMSRGLSFLAVIAGIALKIYAVILGLPFDLQGYGVGISAMISGLGLSIKLKDEKK
jgi:hypothetical protein